MSKRFCSVLVIDLSRIYMLMFREETGDYDRAGTDGPMEATVQHLDDAESEAFEICESVCASCCNSVAGLRNLIDLL